MWKGNSFFNTMTRHLHWKFGCILALAFAVQATAQTPAGFTLDGGNSQLQCQGRVLLDAQRDGFMSIKEIIPAPGGQHFAVVACGFECNDNVGFLFNADGSGKRKFTARWDWILQSGVEWSADGRTLFYYRVNSRGAEAPRSAPATGWVAVDTRTGSKTKAIARRLNTNTSYAVFNVRANDVLQVRARPHISANIVASLAHNAKGVRVTGAAVRANGVVWVPVEAHGAAGWVNQNYLCAERTAQP